MTTDLWVAVFTPDANKIAAIALGGGFSVSFAAYCTPLAPDQNGEWPTGPGPGLECFGAGLVNPAFRTAYINAAAATPALYYTVQNPTPVATMLANHPRGPMYRYYPPEV